MVKNLSQIVAGFKPSIIFYPDPGDDHHDHWATGAFAKYTLAKMDYRGNQFTYLVHLGMSWPSPWAYMPRRDLAPPKKLLGFDETWYKFSLSPDQEKTKRKAVNQYATQRLIMDLFLEAFVRKNELFATYPVLKASRIKSSPGFLSGRILPHTILKDPESDARIRKYKTSGDIISAAVAYNHDHFWIALQTGKNISPEVIYRIHLRVFGKTGVTRLDVKLHRGRVSVEQRAANSVTFAAPVPFQSRGDRIAVPRLWSAITRRASCSAWNPSTPRAQTASIKPPGVWLSCKGLKNPEWN